MLYKKGTILKFQNRNGWYLIRVTRDNKVEGVVVETHHPSRHVGEYSDGWSFDHPLNRGEERFWSIHKESNIRKLLNQIDNDDKRTS